MSGRIAEGIHTTTRGARIVLYRPFRTLHGVILATLALWGCDATLSDVPPPPPSAAGVPGPDYKVVILAIDGPRYSETFGDPTHANIPRMWNDLRPQGSLFTNFRNKGWTTTVPGHTSVLSGTWQYIANDGSERPNQPTLFEYYRKATGAARKDAYVIVGKAKLNVCSYSTHPSYGSTYRAQAISGLSSDLDVYNTLIATLQNDRPHVVMASFSQVDLAGHSGDWNNYLARIQGADSLVANAWAYIQSDTFYAGETYLFITNDHGRHDDAHGGFQNHGDACEGCEHIMCLALGPNVRQDYTVTGGFTQRDIGTTAADILGIAAPNAEGNYMQDMFEPVASGILH